MTLSRVLVVPIALGLLAIGTVFACGEDLVLESPEGGAVDGATNPIPDGGTSDGACIDFAVDCTKSCGQFAQCGVRVACPECNAPATCNAAHSCECIKTTCQLLNAACGKLPDGCGGSLDCGACDGGTCQRLRGSGQFICSATPCVEEAASITCAPNKCQTVANNCAKPITCTCQNQFCLGGGVTGSTCSCPVVERAIHEYAAPGDQDTHHCYDVPGQCPDYTPVDQPKFKIHTTQLPGLVPLHRCPLPDPKSGNTYLSTTPCPVTGAVLGYCSPTPICGALPLYRFVDRVGSGTGDHMYTLDTTVAPVADYTLEPSPASALVCYVWPP